MIKGSKGESSGEEAPNTLQNNSLYKVIDLISEGEIDEILDIYFDNTPFINDDGEENFEGVTISERYGLPDQTYVAGFPSVSRYNNVGSEITKAGGGITKVITDEDVDNVNLILAVAALSVADSKGNINPTSVTMRAYIMPDNGTWVQLDDIVFEGKTNSTYQKMYTIRDVSKYGNAPWSIKIERVNEDAATDVYPKYNNKTYWSGYSEIIDEKLIYPNSAYVALSVDASKFGDSVPVRSFDVNGIKVKIPSNYNPITRSYTGIWNGSFSVTKQWTNNPAWILYDFLTNTRYGVGMDEANVDRYGLYTIAQYCDELVSDGKEGLEPRYTFNAVIDSRASIYDVINLIAGSFNAMPYWSGNLCQFIQDRPIERPYSALVAYSNIIGEFQYSGTALKTRTTVANVKWNNPEYNYEEDVEVVEDSNGIKRYGYNTIDVTAYGCTSRGQAHRYGKWVLYSELNQTNTITYTAGMDHIPILPGDVIEVQDSHKSGAEFGGRIKAIDGTTITLDREVDLVVENSYIITTVLPDRTIVDKVITLPYGKYTEIEVDTAFDVNPIIGSMWVISGTDVASQLFKVIGIAESDIGQFTVTGIEYNENKFRYIEDLPLLKETPISRIPTGAIKPPTEANAEEFKGTTETGLLQVGALISWKPSADPRTMFYKIYMKEVFSDADYVFIGETSGASFEKKDIPNGIYKFRVKAIAPTGDSVYATTDSIEITGITGSPSNVTDFKGNPTTEGVQLTWSPLDEDIISGYEIRQSDSGFGWDDAKIITQDFKGTYLFVPIDVITEQTFFIRAISVLGVYGGAESISVTVAKPNNVLNFEITKQDDSLLFSWDAVIGNSIEYEIRAGSSWGTSEFVLRTGGTNANRLFPGDTTTTFWIKAISGLGLYSDDAIFYNINISLVQNRNIIVTRDERNSDWPGNRVNCTVNTSGEHGELEPGKLGQGNYWSAYNFNVDIGYSAEARNWLDARLLNSAANTTTWDEATYTWGGEQADASWTVIGDLDNVKLTKSIYTKTDITATGIAVLPFHADNNPIIGTTYSDTFSTNTYVDMRLGKGKFFDKLSADKVVISSFEASNDYHFKYTVSLSESANEAPDRLGLTDYTLSVLNFYKSTGVDYNNDRHGTIKLIKKTDNKLYISFYNRYSQIDYNREAPASWENCKNFTIGVYRKEANTSLHIYCHEINEVIEINNIVIDASQLSYYFEFLSSPDSNYSLGNFIMKDDFIEQNKMSDFVKEIEPIGYNKRQELRVGDYIYQEAIIDIELTAPSTSDQMAFWRCKFFTDVVDISESGTENLTTTEWTKIDLTKKFNKLVDVFGWQKTGGELSVLQVQNKQKDSFECRLVTFANQTPITGNIEWMARGY